MNIQEKVRNELVHDESLVWLLKNRKDFGYSDGLGSEKYLGDIFNQANDLSSGSCELERHIKDWPSEYHMSVKRAQLFSGFNFDPQLKVLEVGCGCGAITRYLGETFTEVVSVEGSLSRAKLARLRTRDLSNVSILCAPFQEIEFTQKFDLIFCVGVYEYSASFVSGDTPYESVLEYFDKILSADGAVVIAIENQFGLKYFSSSREDHVGKMFEGIEGYPVSGKKVKTFGKTELESRLKKHFSDIQFFYPYPDYKIPDCVISDEFLSDSRAGELVSQIPSRDYGGTSRRLWDESLVALELSKNKMLPFFSNSFLVFAGKNKIKGCLFDQHAVLYSSNRSEAFRAETRVYNDDDGKIIVSKKTCSGEPQVTVGNLTLAESTTPWKDCYSLQTSLFQNCQLEGATIRDIFNPCIPWLEFLEFESDDRRCLPGHYLDCIWSNTYSRSGRVEFIDKEWAWDEKIELNILIIRAITMFILKLEEGRKRPKALRMRNTRKLISTIAMSLGVKLRDEDFQTYILIESRFQSLVYGGSQKRKALKLKWHLYGLGTFKLAYGIKEFVLRAVIRMKSVMSRFLM